MCLFPLGQEQLFSYRNTCFLLTPIADTKLSNDLHTVLSSSLSSLTALFVEDWSGLMAVETALESRYREFESSKVF